MALDLTGQTFGLLTVIERAENWKWLCLCACGNEAVVQGGHLRSGNTASCGCARKKHMQRRVRPTSEYRAWNNMKSRCCNPNVRSWKDYGGRGIAICDRWMESFENFYADMGPKPGPEFSLDRIDVEGNYEPGNCRWATPLEQTHNRRISV